MYMLLFVLLLLFFFIFSFFFLQIHEDQTYRSVYIGVFLQVWMTNARVDAYLNNFRKISFIIKGNSQSAVKLCDTVLKTHAWTSD